MRLLHQRDDHERCGAAWQNNKKPTEADVRSALDGNLCRCGSHVRVLRAVHGGIRDREADMNASGRNASLFPPRCPQRRRAHGRFRTCRPPRSRRRASAAVRANSRSQGSRRLPCRQRRRHRDAILRQGRSRPGAAHRHSADRRRRARHRCRQDQVCRRRHRADARPGTHVRLERHSARRRADPAGRGDRAQSAHRAGRATAQRQGRGSRYGRRHGAPESRRRRRVLCRSDRRTNSSISSSIPRRR